MLKLKVVAASLAAVVFASHVFAQAPAPEPQRITITGSSIKRIAAEGALPVQTISRDEIERQGITSAEQLVATLTANGTGADNLSSNTGIANNGVTDRNNNGNTSANLRGLGASSTLVLLNGRRISTHGAKGNAVNLSSIPLAAVQRVEVLKDGASAIYGTDAIGGVINFILRSDYRGLEVTGFADVTTDGGGNIYRGSVLYGVGSPDRQGFNFVASLAVDRQERLDARDRPFVNGRQPERGLSPDTSGPPFATLQTSPGSALPTAFTLPTTGTQTYNRANLLSFQSRCADGLQMGQYQSALWGSPGARFACDYDYAGQQVLIQPVERANLMARAAYKFSSDHTAFVELLAAQNTSTKQFEHSQIITSVAAGNAYPVGGPHYIDLTTFIPSFNNTRPLSYRWRCIPCGKRTIETENTAYRVLVGLDGVAWGFDYKLGASVAGDKADSLLIDGYMRTAGFNTLLATGRVNPFSLDGSQTPAVQSEIDAVKASGTKLFGGKTSLQQFDGTLSGEVAKLPFGPVNAAVGFDVRKETYLFKNGQTSTEPVRDAPFDAEFPKVSRDIKAVFFELSLPVYRNLELTGAVRHDRYSDFGDTTNPKVSFLFTPFERMKIRGSYNRGFRAPSFFQLYGATSEGPVPGNLRDPVLCPTGNEGLDVCAIRPLARSGGNRTLMPETSKQGTFGIVVQPTDWLSASLDYWEVTRKDRIYELTAQQVVANFTTFPENLVRGTNGRLDGPGGFIRAGFVNAEGDITRGWDINVSGNGRLGAGRWRASLDGTYIDAFKSRVFATQPYVNTAGQWNSRDLFVRWKHRLSFTYSQGSWSGTLGQSYTSGYFDEKPVGTIPPGFNPRVEAYTVYNASVAYTGIKNLSISAGIKNLLNTDPPFTAHNVDFLAGAGWDPRVGDPRGRALTLRMTYRFF